ncbi:MAG: IS66 family transposase, partial [Candidatus Tectomicrobia bacterium]
MKKPAGTVTLRSEEGEALIAQVHQSNVPPAAAGKLEQIVRMYFWLVFALQEAKLSVKRLRNVVFGSSAQPKEAPESETSTTSSEAPGQEEGGDAPAPADGTAPGFEAAGCEAGAAASESEVEPQPKGGHRAGTGRLGADAYVGAERVECRHEDLAVGQRCPACGQGNLYELPPGVEIRIDGHALLSALRYELHKLRCSACGQIFTAPLPEEAGTAKYRPRARAVLAVSRCYLGLPLYRLEGYQAMLGAPVPDATQWDQIEKVGDCSYKVFAYLESLAAQGDLIHQDDTSVRILSLMAENLKIRAQAEALGLSRPTERTGMFTTGLVVQVGERTICLYYSGRDHAGENLQRLLLQRQAGLDKPLVMSDALSRNEADENGLIRCHCLAHGRRQFSDLEDVFPVECQVVIDALKQVFDHDDEAREQQMSPATRLAYHQTYSQPLMDALKGWLQKQCDDRLVEPNSSLGKAMSYMQTHWKTLTRFLSIPGAPLDNNLVERALKLFIRQRKNSLFFRTEHSAYIASVLTSLIATCLHAGVNALDYLVALQEHRAEV